MRAVQRLERLAREHGWAVVSMSGSRSRLFARGGYSIYVLCDVRGRVHVIRLGEDPPRRDATMVQAAADVIVARGISNEPTTTPED